MTTLILTTDPGLEPILEQEWTERTAATEIQSPVVWHKFLGMKGMVMIECEAVLDVLMPIVASMRSVHHAYRLAQTGKLATEAPIQDLAQGAEIQEMEGAKTFRVTVNRVGEHPYSSYDIAVAMGSALQKRYGTAVNLEVYDVNVRVDVIRASYWIGVQLFHEGLSRRFVRSLHKNVSLKPTVAYGLLRYADISPEEEGVLLDPFCGSGTILLEAAHVFPKLQLMGSDIFPEPIEAARQNVAKNIDDPSRVQLQVADARQLGDFYEADSIRYIVSNPPFGIRVGKNLSFYWFYHDFLQQAYQVMQMEGRLVLLVLRVQFFKDAMKKLGLWHISWSQKIELGGKKVRIYVLKKRNLSQ